MPAELRCGHRLQRVFELLGKRWTGLILSVLLQRPARFSELHRAVPGLSERVLSERLQELIEAGLVQRHVDLGPPLATVYALTEAGERLRPAMEQLASWAATIPAGVREP
jgi:DNA-binding HxlR family transcriptional regulator